MQREPERQTVSETKLDESRERRRSTSGVHSIQMDRREKLTVDGVLRVDSFDEHDVIVETDIGMMHVKGEGLHINELNLTAGSLLLSGFVTGISYSSGGDGQQRAKGLLKRIFK